MNTKSISDKLLSKDIKKENKGTGKYTVAINCIMGSIVTVAIVLVFAFIQMMFKSGADGRRETFFGALYFDVHTLANGNTELNFGLNEAAPIILAMVVVALIYYGIYCIIKKGKNVS